MTVEDAKSVLENDTWIPKGGIRYSNEDHTEYVVYAYFHSHRPGGGVVPEDVLKRLAGKQ